MKSFLKDLRHMLTSGDSDKISSKRFITLIAFIIVSSAFFIDIFTELEVNENMFYGMIQIVFAGLGVVVGEHLLRNKPSNPDENENNENQNNEEEEELGDN